VAFTPKNNEKFIGTGFMLSQITGHKNEDAGLLGYYVVLNVKQIHRPFLHKYKSIGNKRKRLFKTSYKMDKQSPFYEVKGEHNIT
jgi:hypothetical protein